MKIIKFDSFVFHFIVWIPVLIITALLISCKSDTATGPSTGSPQTNDSLLFEKDSLVLRSTGVDSLHFYFKSVPQDSCRIEFTGLTNIDSSKGLFDAEILSINDSFYHTGTSFYRIYKSLGSTYFNCFHNYGSFSWFDPFYVLVYLKINASYTNESKYVILKNIKIYRVKP